MTTRLDELISLRQELDVAIEHERATQARTRLLLTRVHVATTRGSWNTRVFAAACRHFDVTGDAVLSGARDRQTLAARHVAMWLMRDAGRSYTEIGRELGCDHSTVIHAVRRINADDPLLATAHMLRSALTGEDSAA